MRARARAGLVATLLAALVAPAVGPPAAHAVPVGQIDTIAGGGPCCDPGDGGPALDASLDFPVGVDTTADGALIVADYLGGRVRRVDPDGTVTTLADAGDGLFRPQGVAVAADGTIYVTDSGAARVRAITPAGEVTVVAGGGNENGDGVPATDARVETPRGVAVAPDGAVVVSVAGGNRVRRIDPDTQIITTLAGTGVPGSGGDGGPATAAQLERPWDVAFDGAGNLLIADTGNDRVRRVDAGTGVITTVAGTGTGGFSGDGGPASAAQLEFPAGIDVDGAGRVVIADGGNLRIRAIDPATSAIDTIAGSGSQGSAGDGGPATTAELDQPYGVATTTGGDVLIGDAGNGRVRLVTGEPTVPDDGGGFHAIDPVRILDSRTDLGDWNGPLGPDTTELADAVILGGLPSEARAIVANVTVTSPTAASYLTAFPAGSARPDTATVVFAPGETRSVGATIPIGDGGHIALYNQAGSVHVILDVLGWYDDGTGTPGDEFFPVTPQRVLDSRTGVGGWAGKLGERETGTVPVAGEGAIPITAGAVAVNVTVTGGGAPSYLELFPAGGTAGGTASIVFDKGETTSNLLLVGLGDGGRLAVYNRNASVHVVLDVVATFDPSGGGSRFHPIDPVRLVDDRSGTGGVTTPWGPGETRSVDLADGAGLLALLTGPPPVPRVATGVVGNLWVTQGTAPSYLTLHPTGTPDPGTASVVFAPYETTGNHLVAGLADGALVDVANQQGAVSVIVDATGYFAP